MISVDFQGFYSFNWITVNHFHLHSQNIHTDLMPELILWWMAELKRLSTNWSSIKRPTRLEETNLRVNWTIMTITSSDSYPSGVGVVQRN